MHHCQLRRALATVAPSSSPPSPLPVFCTHGRVDVAADDDVVAVPNGPAQPAAQAAADDNPDAQPNPLPGRVELVHQYNKRPRHDPEVRRRWRVGCTWQGEDRLVGLVPYTERLSYRFKRQGARWGGGCTQ